VLPLIRLSGHPATIEVRLRESPGASRSNISAHARACGREGADATWSDSCISVRVPPVVQRVSTLQQQTATPDRFLADHEPQREWRIRAGVDGLNPIAAFDGRGTYPEK